MIHYRLGGKRGRSYKLVEAKDAIAVRTHSRLPVSRVGVITAPVRPAAGELLSKFKQVTRFPMAGVEVLRTDHRNAHALRDQARKVLKKEADIRFAGRVLTDPQSGTPVLYTENLFVKFEDDCSAAEARKILSKYKVAVKRSLAYARNAYFVEMPEGTGFDDLFGVADRILSEEAVQYCHPEVIRQVRQRGAFPQQWHLKKTTVSGNVVDQSASVEAAWALADGSGVTVAIIDEGIDIDHEEFRTSGKIVSPFDATLGTTNPRPGAGENHGTSVAGVACGDGLFGASGVAPKAKLMPIRLQSGLGSQNEADAFFHAAQNGADVISCSWGPADGDPSDPNDPAHQQVVPLADSTRTAIEFAVTSGRNGKGCVVLFAAGNGNESVDNDGYASFNKVIAVAACNDSGKRSFYSDFGNAVWCSFPSNDLVPSKTPGIWTTDRMGTAGYNSGQATKGDLAGNYTSRFGGTSSAAPGAAGVAALVVSRNPNLRGDEVRDILKRCADQIDKPGGAYDASGHSKFYGYGRLNAKTAVDLAVPASPDEVQTRSVAQDTPIKDLQTSTLSLTVADDKALKAIKIGVDLEHTYIGDLVISVVPPAGLGVATLVLHNREGGSTHNLHKTYDVVSTPALSALTGKKPKGTWKLQVADKDRQDQGTLHSFTLEFHF